MILVSFSMGGPVTAVFLNRFVSAAWKDANIYRWLSTSGVFGGVQESLIQQVDTCSLCFAPFIYKADHFAKTGSGHT